MNLSTLRMLAVSSMTLLACSPLPAQSLAQRELITQSKAQMAEHAAATNAKCGTNIKFNVDWATFSDSSSSPDNPNQQSRGRSR